MKPRRLLYQYLLKNTSLSVDEIYLLCARVVKMKLNANHCFQQENFQVTRIGFLTHGIMKEVFTDPEGHTSIIRFISEGNFLVDYEGYVKRRPAMNGLYASTSCKLIFLTKGEIDQLKNLIPGLDYEMMKIANIILSQVNREQQYLRIGNPMDHYLHFLAHYADIAFRLPMKDIAFYLNVTQSSFSRIKRNYFLRLREKENRIKHHSPGNSQNLYYQ